MASVTKKRHADVRIQGIKFLLFSIALKVHENLSPSWAEANLKSTSYILAISKTEEGVLEV